ncbi:MAG: DUF6465 family protein [Lachnospiraceae bacterium]|nr:DUF6465 family protein [Lachnospiraceae bacterium]
MKSNVYVEYQGQQRLMKDVLAAIKKEWTAAGNKIKDIDTLDMYVKPEENTVYYVINNDEETSGSLSL